MSKHRQMGLSLVLLLSLLALSSIAGSGVRPVLADSEFRAVQVVWGTPDNPVSVGPKAGNQKLTATLQYLGSSNITVIGSYIELPWWLGLTNATGGCEAWAYTYTQVKRGSLMTFQYIVNIGDVSLGSYDAYLYVIYINGTEEQSCCLPISLEIKGNVEFEVKGSPLELAPGKINDVRITLTNKGSGHASSVRASVPPPSQVGLISGQSVELGDLSSGQSATFTLSLYVPSSLSGFSFPLTVQISYVDPYGYARTSAYTIYFLAPQLQPQPVSLALSLSPSQITAGRTSTLTISVTNTGSTNVDSLAITLTPQQLTFIGFDGKWYVGSLEPGTTKAINVTVYALSSGAAQITAVLSYIDSLGGSRSETRVLGVILQSEQPELPELTIYASPQQLVCGRENALTISVTNVGSVALSYVTLSLTPPSQLVFRDLDGKVYLGDLAPQETKTVKLTAYVSPTSSGLVQVPLTISYVDPYGNSRSESRALGFTLLTPPSPSISIEVSARTLVAGSINNLTLTITNNNEYAMRSCSLVISFSGGSALAMLTPNNVFLGSVKAGDKVSVPISLYVPASSGDFVNMVATISYYDEGNAYAQYSQSLGLLVLSPPDVRVTNYVVLPQTVSPGQPFSITLTLTNLGIGPAYNVYASIRASESFTPITGTQVYVGNLQSGSSTTITFSFMATNVTAPTTIQRPPTNVSIPRNATFPFGPRSNVTIPGLDGFTVNIALTYQDNLRFSHTLDIAIPVRVSTQTVGGAQATKGTEAQGVLGPFNVISLSAIGAALVAIVALLIVWRRRRGRRPEAE